jgi:hypothetical protein
LFCLLADRTAFNVNENGQRCGRRAKEIAVDSESGRERNGGAWIKGDTMASLDGAVCLSRVAAKGANDLCSGDRKQARESPLATT